MTNIPVHTYLSNQVGVDEEEKMSARARKIYLMKELFGDDSVLDEVGRDISARSLSPTVYSLYSYYTYNPIS